MRSIFATAILLFFASYAIAQEKEETRGETVVKLKSFTDQQLRNSLEKLQDSFDFREDSLYEPCLNEIVRRGGKAWEAVLNAKLEALNKKQVKLGQDVDDAEPGNHYNLELLTALRRVQKKPDPVVVMWDAKVPLEATPLSRPRLKVKIKNVDCEKITVGFRNSGDYRSGRQARWRIVARDGKGTELPVRERLGERHGNIVLKFVGGQYAEDVLEYGQSWETVLDVGSFVKISQPGTYSLEVLYHNTKAIADESDISGLIVSRAKPITLIMRPLVIELTAQERKQAALWIATLNANQRVKVVAGTYGESAYKFVPPTTPEGRLLGMGVKAVPALVESLGDKSLSDKKRAWILALLFSATGENDPRDSGVLGDYEIRETGWQVSGSKPGEGASGGLTPPSEESWSGAKIDREAQDRLVGKWEQWFKNVQVRQGTSNDRPAPQPRPTPPTR